MGTKAPPNHFLDIHNIKREELSALVASARAMKKLTKGAPKATRHAERPLDGCLVALIFERASTRTRVSFDAAIRQLGGDALLLSADEMQLGRGETVADTARVLSRYADALMIRARSHDALTELAHHADIPVINGLTDMSHPCQLLCDMVTIEEHLGRIEGIKVAWLGDGNNVLNSLLHAAGQFRFDVSIACPGNMTPSADAVRFARDQGVSVELGTDAHTAVDEADVVMTDTWVSMNQTALEERRSALARFQVTQEIMAKAKPGAIFMHCLPAHRGEEMSADVIDGPQSVVWDQAENRLHGQKAILRWCLGR